MEPLVYRAEGALLILSSLFSAHFFVCVSLFLWLSVIVPVRASMPRAIRYCMRIHTQIPMITCTVFTNILANSDLERLADADEHEVVREVQVCVTLCVCVSVRAFAFTCMMCAWLAELPHPPPSNSTSTLLPSSPTHASHPHIRLHLYATKLFGCYYAVNPVLASMSTTACSNGLDVWAAEKYIH